MISNNNNNDDNNNNNWTTPVLGAVSYPNRNTR